jgi:hypothetical protein
MKFLLFTTIFTLSVKGNLFDTLENVPKDSVQHNKDSFRMNNRIPSNSFVNGPPGTNFQGYPSWSVGSQNRFQNIQRFPSQPNSWVPYQGYRMPVGNSTRNYNVRGGTFNNMGFNNPGYMGSKPFNLWGYGGQSNMMHNRFGNWKENFGVDLEDNDKGFYYPGSRNPWKSYKSFGLNRGYNRAFMEEIPNFKPSGNFWKSRWNSNNPRYYGKLNDDLPSNNRLSRGHPKLFREEFDDEIPSFELDDDLPIRSNFFWKTRRYPGLFREDFYDEIPSYGTAGYFSKPRWSAGSARTGAFSPIWRYGSINSSRNGYSFRHNKCCINRNRSLGRSNNVARTPCCNARVGTNNNVIHRPCCNARRGVLRGNNTIAAGRNTTVNVTSKPQPTSVVIPKVLDKEIASNNAVNNKNDLKKAAAPKGGVSSNGSSKPQPIAPTPKVLNKESSSNSTVTDNNKKGTPQEGVSGIKN